MNLLNTTHNLFATEDVSITQLWATSDLVLAGPASASVMLVAAEQAGRSPWFLVKSDLAQFARNLEPSATEREFRSPPLTFCDPLNAIRFCVEKIVYEISFNSPSLYWCFKYLVTSQDQYDWHRGFGLDSQGLLRAFFEFTIPGELPSGIRGPLTLQSNLTRARAASCLHPMVVDEDHSSDDRESTVSIGSGNMDEGSRQGVGATGMRTGIRDEDNVELLYTDEYPESDDGMISVLSVDVKVEEMEPSLHDLETDQSIVGVGPSNLDLPVEGSTVSAPVPASSFPNNVMGFLTRFGMDLQRSSLPPPHMAINLDHDPSDIFSQPQHPMKREGFWPDSSDPKRRRLL